MERELGFDPPVVVSLICMSIQNRIDDSHCALRYLRLLSVLRSWMNTANTEIGQLQDNIKSGNKLEARQDSRD